MSRRRAWSPTLAAAILVFLGGVRARALPTLPSDTEVRKLLHERLAAQGDPRGDDFGLVVGLIGPQGRRVVALGHFAAGDRRPLDGDTLFEIGSVTKVFTALLLADLVRQGQLALTDPVAKFLPAGVVVPGRNGRAITLLDLATHTSGLPFMPEDSFAETGSVGGSASARAYRYLAGYRLTRGIGAEWDYSNLGYWLLGEALAARSGLSFEELLQRRVLGPLKLRSTALTLSARQKEKLPPGHNATLQPSQPLPELPIYPIAAAAGGLYSSANDLLAFLAVALGYQRSPLAPALADQLQIRRPGANAKAEQALGWVLEGGGDDPLIVHDGGTFGFASAVAWDRRRKVGVVVLSNQIAGVGDLARHLLRPSVPLGKPPVAKHKEVALDAAILERYAGRYEAEGEGIFVLTREGNALAIQLPESWGLPVLHLHPESPKDFFCSELPLAITIETTPDGTVTGMQVQPPRGQKTIPAKRLGGR